MYCVAQSCKSVYNPKKAIIFHKFPQDPQRRRLWLSMIQLKGKFYNDAKICSLHFKPEDYDPNRPNRLCKSAIPKLVKKVTCGVLGCCSAWNPLSHISFHCITKYKKLLPLWEQVVKINTSENTMICSLHFRDEDFEGDKEEKRLKEDAIPSFGVVELINDATDDKVDEDENDNENLSPLKHLLTKDGNVVPVHRDGRLMEVDEDVESPAQNVEMVNDTTDYETDDDEEDNKNLSTLKQLLTDDRKTVKSYRDGRIIEIEKDGLLTPNQNFEMVMSRTKSARHANFESIHLTETSNAGTQARLKTDKEVKLRAKVKLLDLRLRRREAKISYMNTVFHMIKKHVKGTDMEYKLCCELDNIAKFSESNKIVKTNVSKRPLKAETPDSDHNDDEDINSESSGDESGTFVEVTLSPNLTGREAATHRADK